jgi:hypothetical protein
MFVKNYKNKNPTFCKVCVVVTPNLISGSPFVVLNAQSRSLVRPYYVHTAEFTPGSVLSPVTAAARHMPPGRTCGNMSAATPESGHSTAKSAVKPLQDQTLL